MKLEHLSVKLDTKAVSEDGTFEGYGAVFGNEDRHHEIIEKGAFTDSLKARPGDKVKLLWDHDPRQPIGVYTEIVEDAKGLKVKGRIMSEIARGAEVLALMRAGAVDGLSVGFKTLKDEIDRKTGIRKLKVVDLWECSLCTFAANPLATVHAVKSAEEMRTDIVREIQRATAQIEKVKI